MAKKNIEKGTIYQQLNRFFNLADGFSDTQKTDLEQTRTLIKGSSPQDIEKKALELQQKQSLQDKFFRTTDRGFQKALQYEAARLPAYIDYEGMEYYPIIASALDLFMEEATTIGENGKMLNIYSNKERIKLMLEEFFYEIVNVNVNLPFWTRNMPIKHDSIIPLLDGSEPTIKELSEKLKNNPEKEIWTYSIQNKTNAVVPGKIIWCDLTRKNTQIVRVNLDDETYVETTPDHEFLLRNGNNIKASELKPGDSLMPFHITDHKVISVEYLDNFEDVYCMEVVGPNGEHDRHNFPICSKNKNDEHTRNGVFVSNCKYGDNFVLNYGEKGKGITHIKQCVNYEVERYERIQDGKPTIKFKDRMTGDEFNIFEMSHFRLLGDDKFLPYGSSVLNKIRRVFRQLIMGEDAMLTYRIIRAGEKKVFKIDVGNMDDDDIEDYVYKIATKFKRTSQINPNSGQIDYRFNILGNDEDYFLPVRSGNTQSGIDTLPGASNLDAIQDIEYLRDNLFMGLGIPKPFLSFQDAVGGGKNLAQFDIRFTKKINRMQQAVIQELNKMALIHLYLLGYRDADLGNFTLTLTNPSTQHELLKAELLREKAQTYAELTRNEGGIAPMSHTKAKRYLFNMTDKEIVDDLKQQKMEMAIKQELQDSPVVIKSTGLFKDIDDRYGEPIEGSPISDEEPEEEGDQEGGPMGGQMGDDTVEGPPGPPPEGLGEPPISENKKMSFKEYSDYIENFITGSKTGLDKINPKQIISEYSEKNKKFNTETNTTINEINEMLKDKRFLTENQTEKDRLDGYEEIENIDDLDLDDVD